MGLPGSGKTYISKCLLEHLDADHFNADAVRAQHNDWDFSEEGRMRQVHRMKDLCRESEKPYAIMDFVCPFTQGRQILNPDYIIFMDTIDKGRYADTNKAFQRPLKNEVDYLVEDQNGELHSEVIAREILAENNQPIYNKDGDLKSIDEYVKDFITENPHFQSATPSGSGSKANLGKVDAKPFNIADLDMTKPEDRKQYAEYKKVRDREPTVINLTKS